MHKPPSFIALLVPETFATDEPVGVVAVPQSALPGPLVESEWQYISERMWQRLLFLGQAYGLHFSKVTEPVIDSVLLPEQCQSLIEELAFLRSIVSDPALHQALNVIVAKAEAVARSPGYRLVLSPP